MPFFETAAGIVGKLAISVGSRSFGEALKDIKTKRRMVRLVDSAVDRIVAQMDEYLTAEGCSDKNKEVLIAALAAKFQPLVDQPQRFFEGNLNGDLIFRQSHANGDLPEEIVHEGLEQFYRVLFPQIAQFLSGSTLALEQWRAEGFREEFKRLSQLAEEIRAVGERVAEVSAQTMGLFSTVQDQQAATVLRDIAQTLLGNVLLRLDLSPLSAERTLSGTLKDNFVSPAIRQRIERAEAVEDFDIVMGALVSANRRIILNGGPGVGKSTFALWIQSKLLQASPARLALVFRLREIKDIESRSLLDLVRNICGVHLKDSLSDSIVRSWCIRGQLVIILDGFDEVPEPRRDGVEKWLKTLGLILGDGALIVTSRPLQSGHLQTFSNPWSQWDILPFDTRRIVEFIARWHKYLPANELSETERLIDAEGLAATFLNDPSLKPLSDTPLMLGTLLFVHHRDQKLPSGRVGLYERYIAAMLGQRDTGLGIQARSTRLTDQQKRQVLATIAVHFHVNGLNEIDDQEMRHISIKILKEFALDESVDRLLAALCERSGLLQGPGAWSFMHKTIGEFLVAEVICEGVTRLEDGRRLDRKELWKQRANDAWTAVLFFWIGKTTARELEEFVDDLIGPERDANERLLALSILVDQGRRLTYNTRRRQALRILSEGGIMTEGSGSAVIYPGAMSYRSRNSSLQQIVLATYRLQGFSEQNSIGALIGLLMDGVIVVEDYAKFANDYKQQLLVAALWALSDLPEKVRLEEVARYMVDIERGELAVYCFYSICECNSSLDIAAMLKTWIGLFPDSLGVMPFMLVGAWLNARVGYKRNAAASVSGIYLEMLIARADTDISDSCLLNSYNWVLGFEDKEIDILMDFQKGLLECKQDENCVDRGRVELASIWCETVIKRRESLVSHDM